MNHPAILNDAEWQAFVRKDRRQRRISGWALALIIAAIVLTATSCDDQAMNEAQASATAFFPAKPSHDQQVAYREGEREQLRLKVASK